VHVLAGIVFVGGSAGATSLFPRYAPVLAPVGVGATAGETPPETSDERNRAVALALHRITRVYGIFGIAVPAVGIALAIAQGRMGEIWIMISMVLTAAAGLLLALQIYPRQRDALADPDDGTLLRTLSMTDLQPAVGGGRGADDRAPRRPRVTRANGTPAPTHRARAPVRSPHTPICTSSCTIRRNGANRIHRLPTACIHEGNTRFRRHSPSFRLSLRKMSATFIMTAIPCVTKS
jgi:hypothetical protein